MAALCTALALGGWAVSIIQQSGITPGVLALHPFVSLESSHQLVSAKVCLWPVGRHLQHVSSWPQVIWDGWVNGSHTFMNGQS